MLNLLITIPTPEVIRILSSLLIELRTLLLLQTCSLHSLLRWRPPCTSAPSHEGQQWRGSNGRPCEGSHCPSTWEGGGRRGKGEQRRVRGRGEK